ncbi:MAG: hypothetical protein KVP17_004040 [Porospora cf. gigantea B]|uniref:uncharacterized protein n=2 Tax=Porospora cf. gigantea B TaxID=2853592 RepID=UPI003571E99A|nr:MAG: hypothetical protein KVP17_004040 [Porospora cf. gigantea B]
MKRPWKKIELTESQQNALHWGGCFDVEEIDPADFQGLLALEPVRVDKSSKPKKKKRRKSPSAAVVTPVDPVVYDENAMIEWTSLAASYSAVINQQLLANMYVAGFFSPTEIQRASFKPGIIQRFDVVGCAETGSGKTLAFALPIANCVLAQHAARGGPCGSLTALGVLPSRELCSQVSKEIQKLTKGTTFTSVLLIGGMSPERQTRVLSKQPDMVLGTPGRMCAFMGLKIDRTDDFDGLVTAHPHMTDLRALKCLLLDEADRLVEAGHFPELDVILEKVYDDKKSSDRGIDDLQTFLFSATLNLKAGFRLHHRIRQPTEKLQKKAELKEKMFSVSRLDGLLDRMKLREGKLAVVNVGEDDKSSSLPKNLKVEKIMVPEEDRELYLYALLYQHFEQCKDSRVVIFVNSIDYVYRLESLLGLMFGNDIHNNCIMRDMINRRPKGTEAVTGDVKDTSALVTTSDAKKSKGISLLKNLEKQAQSASRPKEARDVTFTRSADLNFDVRQKIPVVGLHSKLRQSLRMKRVDWFCHPTRLSGILVATDVAARGLDLPANVDLVIHLQCPMNPSIFVHRSGRTARIGRMGTAVAMMTGETLTSWAKVLSGVGTSINDVEAHAVHHLKPHVIKALRGRFRLGCEVESAEHRVKRYRTEKARILCMKKDADISGTDTEHEYDSCDEEVLEYRQKATVLKAKFELLALLKQPLV